MIKKRKITLRRRFMVETKDFKYQRKLEVLFQDNTLRLRDHKDGYPYKGISLDLREP